MDQPLNSGVVGIEAPMVNGIRRRYEIRFTMMHAGDWWLVAAHEEVGDEWVPVRGYSTFTQTKGEAFHQVERFAKSILTAHFDAVGEGRRRAFVGGKPSIGPLIQKAIDHLGEVMPGSVEKARAEAAKVLGSGSSDSWEVE